jgi:DNA-directed RNA polymerase specialized sigma24 family protein
MHHILFIQLLSEKTQSGYAKIYDEYAARLYAFVLAVTDDKPKAESVITKTFTSLWDEPPVLSLHHPDPFLFLLQKTMVQLIGKERVSTELRQSITNHMKNLRRQPQLTVVTPRSSQHTAFSNEAMPRPSA